eukprot:363377-Chlamydomonas_euryale.AAC.7
MLAWCMLRQDRAADAEPLHHKALAGRRAAQGDPHKDTLKPMGTLACLPCNRKNYMEAQTPNAAPTGGENGSETLAGIRNTAMCVYMQSRSAGAAEPVSNNQPLNRPGPQPRRPKTPIYRTVAE